MTPFWEYFLARKPYVDHTASQQILALADQRWRNYTESQMAHHIISAHLGEKAIFSKGIPEFDIGAAAAREFKLEQVIKECLLRLQWSEAQFKTRNLPKHALPYPIMPTVEDYHLGIGMTLLRINQLCGTPVPELRLPIPSDILQYTTEISFDGFRDLLEGP
jgi:hypothetical protein